MKLGLQELKSTEVSFSSADATQAIDFSWYSAQYLAGGAYSSPQTP